MKKITLLLINCLLTISLLAQSNYQLERVEPISWWVGMQNPNLQLLIYGNQIADLKPQTDYPGITIQRITQVTNSNYLFVDLVMAENTRPGTMQLNFQKDGKTQLSYEYPLQAREEGSATRAGFDNSDVLYLITPDRFANGKPANDAVASLKETPRRQEPGGRHGGDIQGLMNHIDYISDLGFTAIWLNPVLENDQENYSYHGYSTTDFYKVDPRYGSNEEYRELCRVAKSKGVKSIMDMIVNHCGSEHWWMKDLPTKDWINFGGEFVQTNHMRTTILDPYASQKDYREFVDGWFVKTMPDLNQNNDFMATYLIQNSIWWVEYAGLSGIRMDTYPYPDRHFMTEWTCRMMEEYPNFNVVGEQWTENTPLVAYWQQGRTNPDGYTSCLTSLMDFPLQAALRDALNAEGDRGWVRLYEALSNDYLYPDPYNLVVFPDNHDMSRFYTQLDENLELFKLGLAYILTTRGIPQIYYGTEILMKNPGTEDHGIIRSDFPGGWPGDAVNAFTGKGLTAQQKEAKAYLRTLAQWRKNAEVIHQGKMLHFAPRDDIYVYFRYDEEAMVMVVLSKNQEAKEIDLSRFAEILPKAAQAVEVISGKTIALDQRLNVPARQAMILELK